MRDLDWKILYELYKNTNLTQVSKLLYLTQPTLTKRLKQIEEELDVTIVNRTAKGLSMTEEGIYLGEKAAEYLQFREQIEEELQNRKENKTEYLNIGSAYTFTKHMLRPVLDPFSEKYPNVNFRITNKQSHILHQMLLEGTIDAAFVRGDYTQGVSCVPILPDCGCIVSKKSFDLKDLPGMNRITFQTSEMTNQLLDNWWKERFGKAKCKEGNSAGYIEFALSSIMADDDYVLCFLPEDVTEYQGLTVTPMLSLDGERIRRNTWFIYRNEKRVSRMLEAFIRYMEAEGKKIAREAGE